MELNGSQFDAFLKSNETAARLFLVYGPDEGLVRERGKALCLKYVDSLDDPFSFVDLTVSDLTSEPTRLADEVTAISMMGGNRVIRLRGATANSKTLIEPLLEESFEQSFLIIEAGDIRKDSALVKMIKNATNGAVTPCFHDKAQDIDSLIRDVLGAAGIVPSRDIIDYLRQNLGSDRAISRQELDKLVLYAGPGARELSLADVQAIIGDSSTQTVFDIIDATLSGNLQALERRLNKAFSAGESPIGFLRLIQGQLKQLHKAAAYMDRGSRSDEALKKAGIPYFNHRKAQGQLSGKTGAHMATCLDITLNAEILCKTTGYPEEVMCRRALMRIAMANRRR